jgi:HEAT repeat protein
MSSLYVRFTRGPVACALLFGLFIASAQDDPKLRVKVIHDLAKAGAGNIPKIEPYLNDSEITVRIEAVKALVDIGTQRSLEPLAKALGDVDPEVEIRATDGLVNFYLPGYIKTGLTASMKRAGTSIMSHFTDTNDQVIDPYVQVRPEIIARLGRTARDGASKDARANAARAAGILRGKAAVPDLIEAAHSKQDQIIYESLVALQKIRDPAAGPQITFLLRDLNPKIQSTALDTIGLLQDRSSIPKVRDVLDHSHDAKVRRSALTALAMMPDAQTHQVFLTYLNDKDDNMRAAAAEGIARTRDSGDVVTVAKAFDGETKTKAKLGDAFALVALGRHESSDNAPLYYLVTQLDSKGYRDVAQAYLIEVARDAAVRKALYPYLQPASTTKDQKIGLARVLGASGDRDAVPYLETLSRDPDAEVADAGLRALRNLRARLG